MICLLFCRWLLIPLVPVKFDADTGNNSSSSGGGGGSGRRDEDGVSSSDGDDDEHFDGDHASYRYGKPSQEHQPTRTLRVVTDGATGTATELQDPLLGDGDYGGRR